MNRLFPIDLIFLKAKSSYQTWVAVSFYQRWVSIKGCSSFQARNSTNQQLGKIIYNFWPHKYIRLHSPCSCHGFLFVNLWEVWGTARWLRRWRGLLPNLKTWVSTPPPPDPQGRRTADTCRLFSDLHLPDIPALGSRRGQKSSLPTRQVWGQPGLHEALPALKEKRKESSYSASLY